MSNLVVTTLNDEAAGSTVLATELADGDGLSLREALAIANADTAIDTITFDSSLAGGTLTLTLGELMITESVIIDGDADGSGDDISDITISGADTSRIFTIDQAGANSITLDALTLTDGYTSNWKGGGAIYAGLMSPGLATGSLTIQNSSFSGNSASGYGGALSLWAVRNVTIDNSAFTDNGSGNTILGGGLYVNQSKGGLVISDSTFSGNQAGGGGAIATIFSSDLTISGSTIANNSASSGGGLYLRDTDFHITNSTFAGNLATHIGDAVYSLSYGDFGLPTVNEFSATDSIILSAGDGREAIEFNDQGSIHDVTNINLYGTNLIQDVNFFGVGTSQTNGTYTQVDDADVPNIFDEVTTVTINGTAVATGVLSDSDGVGQTIALQYDGLAHDAETGATIGGGEEVGVSPYGLNIVDAGQVFDDGTLALNGARSATTAEIGGTSYLFVASWVDRGVQVFSVGSDGSLTDAGQVFDTATLALNGATSVTTAEIGGTPYLFVSSYYDGVQVFSIGSGGSLTDAGQVFDNATLALDGAYSVTTAEVGGTSYLFVTGRYEDGIQVFSIGTDGSLTDAGQVFDDATLALDGASSVTTAEIGGTTYLFVAGQSDDGVQVFSVGSDGSLTDAGQVFDDASLALDGVQSVTTAEIDGTPYLFVASVGDDGVQVFSIGSDGSLTDAVQVFDDATLALDAAISVTTAEIGGTPYLFIASAYDDGVQLFTIGTDGSLADAGQITDDTTLALNGAVSVTTDEIDSTPYLFVGSSVDDSVQTLALEPIAAPVTGTGNADSLEGSSMAELIEGHGGDDQLNGFESGDTLDGGAGSDMLNGGSGDDSLSGGAGNDILYGGQGDDQLNGDQGNDHLTGGSGLDTFVFDTNWGTDMVGDFTDGEDMLDLSSTSLQFTDLTITQNGTDTMITEAGGNSILLIGVIATDLTASDFMFT